MKGPSRGPKVPSPCPGRMKESPVERRRTKRSTGPSWVKSPPPAITSYDANEPGTWTLAAKPPAPFPARNHRAPVVSRARRSGRPSPFRSPGPTIVS